MSRFKMMSGLTAVALVAVALAGSASPAGAVTQDTKRPQEYYKKIQHQWVMKQQAVVNGNMKAAKMHLRKLRALTEQYRQRVQLAENAEGPSASPGTTWVLSVPFPEVVLWDPSLY
jgi:hypothetical protein